MNLLDTEAICPTRELAMQVLCDLDIPSVCEHWWIIQQHRDEAYRTLKLISYCAKKLGPGIQCDATCEAKAA